MAPSPASTRGGRCAVAALSVSLAAVGLTASAQPSGAVSPSIAYSCTSPDLGSFTLALTLDTTAPARMQVGQSVQLAMTASAQLPGSVAKAAVTAGATELGGSWVVQAAFGGAPAGVSQTIAPRAPLGPQTVETPVPFTASSAAFSYVAPATPGVIAVTAGDLAGTLQFYPSGGGAITCTAPNGKAPVIDTITVVAPSATTLTLDRTTSEYGQDVTATAAVTTSAGTPDGDVAFSVDGVATKARVGNDGVASLVLLDAGAGAHGVSATFVPRDPMAYDGSATPQQTWTVTKARTRMRIPVSGRTTAVATRVGVKAKGVFDTVPTGKVRIRLKRLGTPGTRAKVRTLDATGAATAGFGTLTKGRYRAIVIYRGDDNHRYLKKSKTFRVTRG